MITISPKLKTSKGNYVFRWTFLGSNCVWEQFDHYYYYITLLLNYFFMLGGRAGGFTIILSVFSAGRKYTSSEGSSSANCQKTETCMVRACHTPRQPFHDSLRHLGVWATPWSAEETLDGQHQRVDILAHARTAHKGLLQKRLEEDLCWIVPHVPRRPSRSRDWTELNWRWLTISGTAWMPKTPSSVVARVSDAEASLKLGARSALTSPDSNRSDVKWSGYLWTLKNNSKSQ